MHGRPLGFDGKTLIHPRRSRRRNEVFAPSEDEVAFARKIIAAFAQPENKGKGVITVEGRMVELLHAEYGRAHRRHRRGHRGAALMMTVARPIGAVLRGFPVRPDDPPRDAAQLHGKAMWRSISALYGSRFAVTRRTNSPGISAIARAPLDDLLVFHMVFGKTVPDISLNAIANLGYADCRFLSPSIRATRCAPPPR